MSFMVGEAGMVYEADLGEDTLTVAAAIDSFDPGEGWSPGRGRRIAACSSAVVVERDADGRTRAAIRRWRSTTCPRAR